MKAEINKLGTLEIWAESETEQYAINAWKDSATFPFDDPKTLSKYAYAGARIDLKPNGKVYK